MIVSVCGSILVTEWSAGGPGLLQTFYEGVLLNVWTPLQANSRVDRGVASGDSGIWG
jgi:hypothetical protein